jgi:PhnB protein
MQIVCYLNFNGDCEAAFQFYEKCLGGKITGIFRYADMPPGADVPEGWSSKVMHATLVAGAAELMGADSPPTRYSKPQGVSVALQLEGAAEAEQIFHALSEGARITMPLAETFWAERFGMLVDRFGIPWMINCGKPA